MNELKNNITSAIEDWKYKKLSDIDIDPNTDFEIFKEINKCLGRIIDELEDLNDIIDSLIETMNEPSDYEYDMHMDMIQRTNDLIRSDK